MIESERSGLSGRYNRNKNTISAEEQKVLKAATACVVGLGGLGGHIAEQLARLGIGELILIDGDIVEESNLNRQLFATEKTLGLNKAAAAELRLRDVNSEVRCKFHSQKLTDENALELLCGADIVFDAVDNIPTRKLMQRACRELNLPLIHGAIGGWYGQVSVVMPDDDTFDKLYPKESGKGLESVLGNPAFTPAIIASIQVAEAVKYLLGTGELLRGKLLRFDLLMQEYTIIQL